MSKHAKRFHQTQDLCYQCGYKGNNNEFLNYGSISFCSSRCVSEYAGVDEDQDGTLIETYEPSELDSRDFGDFNNE